nr:MAG TPA: hypothetical protein [Caudoviricetes sp.]
MSFHSPITLLNDILLKWYKYNSKWKRGEKIYEFI